MTVADPVGSPHWRVTNIKRSLRTFMNQQVGSDIQNPTLVADAYCNKQVKVAFFDNLTPKRAVFSCQASL
jgi:hypothetical protein